MYDTILLPTDGSDHSVQAARHGGYLAKVFDATVHVINVFDVQSVPGVMKEDVLREQFAQHLSAEGRQSLESVSSVFDDQLSITTAVLEGEPADTILEYADEYDADVVVMGTHGRRGVDRYISGSVTERVLRHSKIPVLTVRASDRNRSVSGYEDILIPTDGSEPASAAIEHGLEIATRTGGRIHAVNVIDVGKLAASPTITPPTELIENLESNGEAVTERIAARARERGLEAHTTVRKGYPGEALIEYVDEHDIDLVTMGTAGRRGLGRFLMGSTTEHVIREAAIPVFAVRADEGQMN